MPIVESIPHDLKNLHDQKSLKSITDEEFADLFAPPTANTAGKIWRTISFILFFGWLRMLLTFLFLFVFFIEVTILPVFERFFDSKPQFKLWAHKVCKPTIRTVLFFSGFIWINVKGKRDPEARIFVCNHLTLIDIVSVLYQIPFSIVAHDGLRGNPFIENTGKIFDAMFVDRSAKTGFTQQIIENCENKDRLPLVIFPEGKISNGNAVLKFRTGAFVPDCVLQPVTLRYKMLFTPKGLMSPCWLQDNFLEYIFVLWSIPAMIMDFEFLPAIRMPGAKPEDKAEAAQLEMANHFGTLAVDRTNKEIFQNKKTD